MKKNQVSAKHVAGEKLEKINSFQNAERTLFVNRTKFVTTTNWKIAQQAIDLAMEEIEIGTKYILDRPTRFNGQMTFETSLGTVFATVETFGFDAMITINTVDLNAVEIPFLEIEFESAFA